MTTQIEYAGGAMRLPAELVKMKTRGAPRWWLELASRGAGVSSPAPASPAPSRPASPRASTQDTGREIGWIAGTVCPAVSSPAYSAHDKRELPEQFSDACMALMLRQTRQQEKPIPIKWGHRGEVIATTRNLDVLFSISRRAGFYTGLEFEARLSLTNELHRRVLADAANGLGVSIGYMSRSQYIIERDGVGEVRVVTDAVLDHVAILPPSETLVATFPAARCYAGQGKWYGCPSGLHERARLDAYAVWKRQAGIGG